MSQELALQFWNNAQDLYGCLVEKTLQGRILTGQEALTMYQLGRMLERYYTLQRHILERDIAEWEPDENGEDESDGLTGAST